MFIKNERKRKKKLNGYQQRFQLEYIKMSGARIRKKKREMDIMWEMGRWCINNIGGYWLLDIA